MDSGQESNTGLWMVPYADLMSTLVILFLGLYAFTYNRQGPAVPNALKRIELQVSPGTPQEARVRREVEETAVAVQIQEVLKGLRLEEFGVRVSARYVHLELPEPVLFAFGSARLSPEAGPVLSALAGILGRLDNPVVVEGHTDDRPIAGGRYRTNWELSGARAFSVIDYFLRSGLSAARFTARGYGEYRPAADNATEEGRRRNRRIEMKITRGIWDSESIP